MLKIGVITMALLSFLNANWFTDLFDDTPKPPIYVPIDMSKTGKVADFIIRSDDSEKTRYFSLVFATRVDGKYDFHWDSWIYKFLGHGSIEGIKTPARLTIYRLKKDEEPTLIFDKVIKAGGTIGGKGVLNKQKGNYSMRYIYSRKLPQGHYRIKLENLQNFPELKDINIFFGVHFGRGKV